MLLDTEIINELLLARKRNPNAVKDLIALARREFQKYHDSLLLSFQQNNLTESKQIAHKLKGACAGMGFKKAFEICRNLEEKLLQNQEYKSEFESLQEVLAASFLLIQKIESETP